MCLLQSPDTVSYSLQPVKLNILAKYLSCLNNNLFLLMITEKGVLTTSREDGGRTDLNDLFAHVVPSLFGF